MVNISNEIIESVFTLFHSEPFVSRWSDQKESMQYEIINVHLSQKCLDYVLEFLFLAFVLIHNNQNIE